MYTDRWFLDTRGNHSIRHISDKLLCRPPETNTILCVNYKIIKIKNTAVTRSCHSRTNAQWVSVRGWRVLGAARQFGEGAPTHRPFITRAAAASMERRCTQRTILRAVAMWEWLLGTGLLTQHQKGNLKSWAGRAGGSDKEYFLSAMPEEGTSFPLAYGSIADAVNHSRRKRKLK